MVSKNRGANLEAHARVTANSVVQFETGMVEIHDGTAAGVDRAVFPLARSTLAAARLDRSPAPTVVVSWRKTATPGGARFFLMGETRPRSLEGCAGPTDGTRSMGNFKRTKNHTGWSVTVSSRHPNASTSTRYGG